MQVNTNQLEIINFLIKYDLMVNFIPLNRTNSIVSYKPDNEFYYIIEFDCQTGVFNMKRTDNFSEIKQYENS